MMHNMMAAEAAFMKEHPNFKKNVRKFFAKAGERYGPELMAWGNSKSVKAAEAHKMGMMKSSKELHTVISDVFTMYNEFAHGGVEMGWGMNADGSYDEWISNKSARHIFEEMYQLAKDLRAFIESPMARNQRRLEKLTLNDPHAAKLFHMLQDDLNIHTCEQFKTRAMQLAMRIKSELESCPYAKKMMGLMMKMHKLVESSKQVSDLDAEGYVAWWNKKHFTNPFEGMKP